MKSVFNINKVLLLLFVLCSCTHIKKEERSAASEPPVESEIPFQEVLAKEIGPKNTNTLAGFNINYFKPKAGASEVNCRELAQSKKCPAKMVMVCSEHFKTAVCVDQDLYNDPATGRPMGNMNLAMCQKACQQQNKRIPTNNEWLVSCTGSRPDDCNVYYKNGGVHSSTHYSKVPGHVCNPNTNVRGSGPYNSLCMTSRDFIKLLPEAPQCVSEAGVRGCIGSFHQWVSQHVIGAQHGYFRFNGGSFVVPQSAVDYVTPAHDNSFFHFANGCRCATEPK